MEPATFAAELISRLEKLKLELESRHSLEERLQQIREVVRGPVHSPGRPAPRCPHPSAVPARRGAAPPRDPLTTQAGPSCLRVPSPFCRLTLRMKRRRPPSLR